MKKCLFIVFITIIVVAGCTNSNEKKVTQEQAVKDKENNNQEKGIEEKQENVSEVSYNKHNNSDSNEEKKFKSILPPNQKVNPQVLKDERTLIDRVKKIHDYIAFKYHKEELEKLKNQAGNRHYKKVLNRFAKGKLGVGIKSIQTIVSHSDRRTFMVITNNRYVLKITMKKMPDYNNIWVVTKVGVL